MTAMSVIIVALNAAIPGLARDTHAFELHRPVNRHSRVFVIISIISQSSRYSASKFSPRLRVAGRAIRRSLEQLVYRTRVRRRITRALISMPKLA
ncbi:MAG: hypothetical protein ACREQF_07500 [Candidatus Binataceae bacterium]